MIPFEYTMVREDETVFGIAEMIEADIKRMGTEHIPLSEYSRIVDEEIARDPTNHIGYVKKALFLQKQTQAALKVLDEGVRVVGENHLFYHARGMVYEHADQRSRAITEFKRALELYPIAAETIISMGTLLNRDGRYQEAVEYWNRLIEMNPCDWIAWNGKSNSEYNLGDYERAIKHMTAATFCAPNMSQFYVNRGQILLETSKLDDAFSDFDHAVHCGEEKTRVTQVMKRQTEKLLKSGKHADLVRIYEKADQIDPDNLDTLVGLCGSYGLLGRKEDLAKYSQKLQSVSLRATNVEELEMVGQVLVSMDKLRDAAGVAKRLYELTKNRDYLINLGRIAMELDDRTLIEPYLSELIEVTSAQSQPGKKYNDVGRNDPCPCGSGQKFKKCHGT